MAIRQVKHGTKVHLLLLPLVCEEAGATGTAGICTRSTFQVVVLL